jgi:hypothetical protein
VPSVSVELYVGLHARHFSYLKDLLAVDAICDEQGNFHILELNGVAHIDECPLLFLSM